MIYEYGGQIKCRYNFWTYVISTMIGKHTFILDYYILVALSKLVDKIGFKMYNHSLNDFPVIRDPCMRKGFWDRQGANIASR